MIKFSRIPYILTLAFLFLAVGCKKPSLKSVPVVNEPEPEKIEPKPKKSKTPEVSYPIDRLINDSQGREMDVSIIGRDASNLVFLRKLDGKRFTFPIAKLSKKDGAFASSLPMKSAPDEKIGEAMKSNYVLVREKEIERLNAKLEDLQKEASSNASNSLKLKGISRSMKKLNAEIRAVEEQVSNHQKR